MKYDDMSDEDIVKLAQDGDSGAADYILEKYSRYVKVESRLFYIVGADNDDVVQEGMIGLFKAVREYDPGKNAAFSTYATLSIKGQILNAINTANRQKNIPLNDYISIYLDGSGRDENSQIQFIDVLMDSYYASPEEAIINKEKSDEKKNILEKTLSSFEKRVVELYLSGMSYAEIGKILGKTEKQINNALTRVRNKIREKIKNAEN